MNTTGIIILAAGNSSRLGMAKQLLNFNNTSFITHTTGEALKAKLYPVIIITGANADQVSSALNEQDVKIVYNELWQQGMGSGIVAGISELMKPGYLAENVIIAVCDQPFVSSQLFLQLIKKKSESGKGIVASTYADTTGSPVLFGHKYFKHLQQLKGEEGAKKLLNIYQDDLATIAFPAGSIDIDTMDDYKKLIS